MDVDCRPRNVPASPSSSLAHNVDSYAALSLLPIQVTDNREAQMLMAKTEELLEMTNHIRPVQAVGGIEGVAYLSGS